jgi:penicillin-binding protein 1A
MVEEGLISSEDMERASRIPLRLMSNPVSPLEKAPYFIEHVRKYVEEKYGKDALYKGGLRVYTTVDLGMQKAAEGALELGLKEIEKRQKHSIQTASSLLEGALVTFDLDTGYVKALVGGRDYRRSQFNRVTQARRQTGSAFKPIVYAAAWITIYARLHHRRLHPFSSNGRQQWQPKISRRVPGAITVRNALTHSVNVVTVKIAQDLGVDYLQDYARTLGISSPLHGDLSMALGSSALSLFELTKAYGVFANEGKTFKPILVKKILDRHGNLLEENPPLFLSQESLEDIRSHQSRRPLT